MPQIINVTSGLNLARRYFHTAQCVDSSSASYKCQQQEIPALKLDFNFTAQMAIMVVDGRKSARNMADKLEQIEITISVKDGTTDSEFKVKVDPTNPLRLLRKSMPMEMVIINCATCVVSLLMMFVVYLRRVCKCCPTMKSKILYVDAVDLIRRRDRFDGMTVPEIIREIMSKPKTALQQRALNDPIYLETNPEMQPLKFQSENQNIETRQPPQILLDSDTEAKHIERLPLED